MVRRVYRKKKPGRPKGTKNSTYNLTADGLVRKQKAARKVANRLHRDGRAGSGYFKYHEYPQEGVERCRKATLRKIADGTFNPAMNIRKFIAAGGSKKYWNSRVNRGTHGMFYSKKNRKRLRYDSSWELKRMEYLEVNKLVVRCEKNPVQIPYNLNGQAHYYFPDFLVEYRDGHRVLEEVKPKEFLDYQVNVEKFKVARIFCKSLKIKFKILSSEKELET